ncbi:MAG TPA: hypothetical protein VL500_06090 [Candidatus Eisenbacteria bacterium]|nr:hypothetical protein [Candidatus Eisenbacteria bacterium]
MKKALVLALFSLLWSLPAQASVMGIAPGDLIKLKDDHDAGTTEDKVVYYYDQDWFRHPFPNQKVYDSWYKDFSGVKELTKEEMAEIRLAKPITYRPGTRLVKIPSIPKVYAVEPGGVLRWVETESVAKALYGNEWNKRVDDVAESFFTTYKEGTPLTTPVWPTGTFVRRDSDTALYVIEGLQRRYIAPAVLPSLRLNESHVIHGAGGLSDYAEAGAVAEGDWKYLDAAQNSYIDTLPRPSFDFPVGSQPLVAGGEQSLATFRLTSGMPVIIRRMRVRISGPLWNGGSPRLTGIRLVDVNGQNLFGTQQLAVQGSTEETLTFSGAYTMPEKTISIVELKAETAADLGAGAAYTVSIERDGVQLADGGNGALLTDFWPRTAFPTFTVK